MEFDKGQDSFIRNNIIVFFSSSTVNLFNFLYQIFMARNLSYVNYGILNSLFSIFMIISLPIAAFTTMVAKFTSEYAARKETEEAYVFIFRLIQHMFIVSSIFIVVYFFYALHMKDFLKLDSITPIYIVGCLLFFMNISSITLGGLQGFESFIWYSVSNLSGAIIKFVLAVLFVWLGWAVLGALSAVLIAQFLSLLVSFIPFRKYISKYFFTTKKEINLLSRYRYITPILLTYISYAVLVNIDIILVKHFFKPLEAGFYSIAQMIGKIVLFLPLAIATVMLPRVSGLYAQKMDSQEILKKSLIITAGLCISVVLFYNMYPEFMLKVFTAKVDGQIILLGRLFSIAMTFFSLLYVLLLYQLSINNLRFIKWILFGALLQICAIWIFHPNLSTVIYIVIINSIILFCINLRLSIKQMKAVG